MEGLKRGLELLNGWHWTSFADESPQNKRKGFRPANGHFPWERSYEIQSNMIQPQFPSTPPYFVA